MASPLKKLKRRLTVLFNRKSVSTTNLAGARFDMSGSEVHANCKYFYIWKIDFFMVFLAAAHFLDVNPDSKISFMKRSKSVFTSLSKFLFLST